jgi:hypothetical protein
VIDFQIKLGHSMSSVDCSSFWDTGWSVIVLLGESTFTTSSSDLFFSPSELEGTKLFMITASSAVYHSALATNYRNWPHQYRSVAVGLTVSWFGLSAFIFTKIGSAWFMNEDKVFLW